MTTFLLLGVLGGGASRSWLFIVPTSASYAVKPCSGIPQASAGDL